MKLTENLDNRQPEDRLAKEKPDLLQLSKYVSFKKKLSKYAEADVDGSSLSPYVLTDVLDYSITNPFIFLYHLSFMVGLAEGGSSSMVLKSRSWV
jgi:hypothetical protein